VWARCVRGSGPRAVTKVPGRRGRPTLRVAFLSGFVLELTAAVATALVAVEVGLRLLAGHVSYQTALLVLLLTPEAYLPLRAVGAQFHITEGWPSAVRTLSSSGPTAPIRGSGRQTSGRTHDLAPRA
jgi:ATP-binding cassette, subfamily C, bacterial CydD